MERTVKMAAKYLLEGAKTVLALNALDHAGGLTLLAHNNVQNIS